MNQFPLFRIILLTSMVVIGPAAAQEDDRTSSIPRKAELFEPEGYGAVTRGGEGGQVIWVTSLAEKGPGSLAAAFAAEGPRVIKFKVGGEIKLSKTLTLESAKRVTIDGLSAAPYGGITITGGLQIAHGEDIIVRHLRCRGGRNSLPTIHSRRVLIDHCSAAWASDQVLDAWDSTDVTLQWCIIAEGLVDGGHEKGPHSCGSLQGGGATRVTTHHCLLTGSLDRNPLCAGPRLDDFEKRAPYRFDVVNNVVYNYWNASKTSSGSRVNFIANYYRLGPDSSESKPEIFLSPSNYGKPDYETRVHCAGNIGPHRTGTDLGEFGIVMILSEENLDGPKKHGFYGEGANRFLSRTPFSTPATAQVKVQTATAAYRDVLSYAGAWPRDEVDQRLIREVRERQGAIGRVGPRWRQIYEEFQKKQAEEKKSP